MSLKETTDFLVKNSDVVYPSIAAVLLHNYGDITNDLLETNILITAIMASHANVDLSIEGIVSFCDETLDVEKKCIESLKEVSNDKIAIVEFERLGDVCLVVARKGLVVFDVEGFSDTRRYGKPIAAYVVRKKEDE